MLLRNSHKPPIKPLRKGQHVSRMDGSFLRIYRIDGFVTDVTIVLQPVDVYGNDIGSDLVLEVDLPFFYSMYNQVVDMDGN